MCTHSSTPPPTCTGKHSRVWYIITYTLCRSPCCRRWRSTCLTRAAARSCASLPATWRTTPSAAARGQEGRCAGPFSSAWHVVVHIMAASCLCAVCAFSGRSVTGSSAGRGGALRWPIFKCVAGPLEMLRAASVQCVLVLLRSNLHLQQPFQSKTSRTWKCTWPKHLAPLAAPPHLQVGWRS